MKKFLEIFIYALIGSVVLWAGGDWYHMLIAQGLAGIGNLIGYAQALEERS